MDASERHAQPDEDRLSHLSKGERFYRNCRAQVSLLLAQGHQHAARYPLGKVWYEAQLVNERVNGLLATEITLMHAAMVAVLEPKGKGVKHLNKLIRKLRDGH